MAEIQQLSHPKQHINTGDVIQIEVLDFDPDIDEVPPTSTDQNIEHQESQGSVISTQKFAEKTAECRTHASSHQDVQDIDWLDAIQWKSHHSLTRILNKIHLLYQYDMR